jgi:DNA primase
MITQNSIEKLKNSIDIVDVIGNYLELKKTGANFKARCPFHGEKTPSFVVSPQKQIFHCFGCGIGGDAIKFVMEYEKLSYPEAIEKLAREYNITLEYSKSSKSNSDEKRVLELLKNFYKKNLDKNSEVLNYLKQRGLSQNSIEVFELGYVDSSNSVIEFLKANQIPLPAALKAGVLALNERKNYYARLTQRVIFPIFNQSGAIIGFGGRTLTNHPAKYINSPQTALFDKSRVFYGLNLAKKEIYAKGQIIITEGYLDVIMLHQAGFKNTVATLGTALTSSHIPLIKKAQAKAVLAYDGDNAGVAAAFKAAKLLITSNLEGSVVLFPKGKDPADMVKEGNLEELKKLLNNGIDLGVFIIEQIKSGYDLKNPYQKQKAINEVKSFLKNLSGVVKDFYTQEASRIFGVNSAFFKTKNKAEQKIIEPKKDAAWEAILKTLMHNLNLIDEVLNVLDFSFAKDYEDAFRNLAANNLDHPILRGIEIDEKVPILNEDEFKAQILKELDIFYRQKLKELTLRKDLDFNKKTYLIRKIKTDILPKIKKGEVVVYESDFSI